MKGGPLFKKIIYSSWFLASIPAILSMIGPVSGAQARYAASSPSGRQTIERALGRRHDLSRVLPRSSQARKLNALEKRANEVAARS